MYFLVGIVVFVILLGLKGANKLIACHNRKKCPPLSNIVIYIFLILKTNLVLGSLKINYLGTNISFKTRFGLIPE